MVITASQDAIWAVLGLPPALAAGRGISGPVSDRADAALARGLATTDAALYFLPGDLATRRDTPGRRRRDAAFCREAIV